MTTKTLLAATAVSLVSLWSCSDKVQDRFGELNAEAAKEYLTPIRPASEGRNPCWNEFCKKFIYAPAFDVKAVEGADNYKFIIKEKDDRGSGPSLRQILAPTSLRSGPRFLPLRLT